MLSVKILGHGKKGFMHVVEIVIIALIMFIVIFQFSIIPSIRTEWSATKVALIGNDLIHSLDSSGVDWLNSSELNKTILDAMPGQLSSNASILFSVEVGGAVKPKMRIGCICDDNEVSIITDALPSFQLNGREISFEVEKISPTTPAFSELYDVVVIMQSFFKDVTAGDIHNPYSLETFNSHITKYLASGRGILLINNTINSPPGQGYFITTETFGIGWDNVINPSGDLVFNSSIIPLQSRYHNINRYFYNFSNINGKIAYPTTFPNFIGANEKVVAHENSKAECVLHDGEESCGLLVNDGVENGFGRTAWLTMPEAGTFSSALFPERSMLLKSLLVWLSGSKNIVTRNQMQSPTISRIMRDIGPPGLVLRYGFDEGSGKTLHDQSGNTNNGTVVSGNLEPGNGVVGGRLSLSGLANDYARFEPSQSIRRMREEFTIAGWLNMPEVDPNTIYPILSNPIKDKSIENILSVHHNGKLHVGWKESDSDTNCFAESLPMAIKKETWHHFAAVYNREKMIVYVDGISNSLPSTPCENMYMEVVKGDYFIGKDRDDNYFNGVIDELTFYSKALSKDEIDGLRLFPDQYIHQPAQIVLTMGYIY